MCVYTYTYIAALYVHMYVCIHIQIKVNRDISTINAINSNVALNIVIE